MESPGFDYEKQVPAGFYDQIHRRQSGVRYCWHDLKFRAVASKLGAARRLLDIGCGPGTFIGNYAPDAEALGIDSSAIQIDYAEKHYGNDRHRFSTETLVALRAAGRTFDAIVAIEAIEHLTEGDAFDLMTEARALLSPEGRLILTTPNYASLWPIIEWGVNRVSDVGYEQQHVNKYRRSRLVAQLSGAGYRDVRIETIVGFAPFTAVFGLAMARAVNSVETAVGHLGAGNLLLALARA
jgi:2-polyprenyl-3-methyl-5-hydroxy-6-metoxy-1,4-benzoquinol methylase